VKGWTSERERMAPASKVSKLFLRPGGNSNEGIYKWQRDVKLSHVPASK
jgi:hypothetical protein